jgi:hypothetical protein
MLLVDSTEPFQRRDLSGRLLVTITSCRLSSVRRFVCSLCSNGTPWKDRNARKRSGRACRFGGLGHTPTLPQHCFGEATLHHDVSSRMPSPPRLALVSQVPAGASGAASGEPRATLWNSIARKYQGRSMRFLMIEDEPQIAAYLGRWLGQLHGIVDIVSSLSEAKQAL